MFEYRLCRRKNGLLFICEVLLDEDGNIIQLNKNVDMPDGDTINDILDELHVIIKDITSKPVINV